MGFVEWRKTSHELVKSPVWRMSIVINQDDTNLKLGKFQYQYIIYKNRKRLKFFGQIYSISWGVRKWEMGLKFQHKSLITICKNEWAPKLDNIFGGYFDLKKSQSWLWTNHYIHVITIWFQWIKYNQFGRERGTGNVNMNF